MFWEKNWAIFLVPSFWALEKSFKCQCIILCVLMQQTLWKFPYTHALIMASGNKQFEQLSVRNFNLEKQKRTFFEEWGWNLEPFFHTLKYNVISRICSMQFFYLWHCCTQSKLHFYAKWIKDSKRDLCKNSISLGISSFFWNTSFQVELVKVVLNYSELILLFKWLALSKAAIYWLSIS